MPKITYTPKTGRKICEHLALGMPLPLILKNNGIKYATFLSWLRREDLPELREMYHQAKDDQADIYAYEVVQISDELTDKLFELQKLINSKNNISRNEVEAYSVLSKHMINTARVRIDSRKWSAGKQRPKKYGDRIIQEVEGEKILPKDNLDLAKLTNEELDVFENLCDKARTDKGRESETKST